MPSTTEFRITILNIFFNRLQGGSWLWALMYLAAALVFKVWLIMIVLPKSLTVNLYTASEASLPYCSFHCSMIAAHRYGNIMVLQYSLTWKFEMVIASMLGYIGINPTEFVYNISQQFLKPNNLLLLYFYYFLRPFSLKM